VKGLMEKFYLEGEICPSLQFLPLNYERTRYGDQGLVMARLGISPTTSTASLDRINGFATTKIPQLQGFLINQ
ncbi:hypothetical protein HAX54_012626, partial [Datura stramonium]|nr:hypothetical protein [Datura stramonium]